MSDELRQYLISRLPRLTLALDSLADRNLAVCCSYSGGWQAPTFQTHAVSDADFEEKDHPRDDDGKFTDKDGGEGGSETKETEYTKAEELYARYWGLAHPIKAPPAKLKLKRAVVEVGGDQWNRHTAVKLEAEYQRSKPNIEASLDKVIAAAAAKGKVGEYRDWADLPEVVKIDAGETFVRLNKSDFVTPSLDYWKKTKLEDAATASVLKDFNGDEPTVIDEIANTLRLETPGIDKAEAKEAITKYVKVTKRPQKSIGGPFEISIDYNKIAEALGTVPPVKETIRHYLDGSLDLYKKIYTNQYRGSAEADKDVADYAIWEWTNKRDEVKFELADKYDKDGDLKIEKGIGKADIPKTFYPLGGHEVLEDFTSGAISNEEWRDVSADVVKTKRLAKALQTQHSYDLLKERGLLDDDTSLDMVADYVDDIWTSWKNSSTNTIGLLMQQAAADELGARFRTAYENDVQDARSRFTDPAKMGERDYSYWADIGSYDGLKALMRAQWETMQYLLDKGSIDKADLYRGLSVDGIGEKVEGSPETYTGYTTEELERDLKNPQLKENKEAFAEIEAEVAHRKATIEETVEEVEGEMPGGHYGEPWKKLKNVKLERNGCMSTTLDRDVANNWRSDEDSVTLRCSVPRTAILSAPVFGLAVHEEQEVVVLGTAWKGWDLWHRGAPDFGEVPLATAMAADAEPEKEKKPLVINVFDMEMENESPHWLKDYRKKKDDEAETAAQEKAEDAEFKEEEHDRDQGGKFTAGGSGAGGKEPGAKPKASEREAKIARLKEIGEKIKPFAVKEYLSAGEARAYEKLSKEAMSLRFEVTRPLTPERVLDSDKSTLKPDTVVAAHNDMFRNRAGYDALGSAVAGAAFGADTDVDKIMMGQNSKISPSEFYHQFDNTRAALRDQYGPTVTLYRAEGKQKRKATTNWATTHAFAAQFGPKVVKRDIPVEQIIAANIAARGRYHELIVGEPPKAAQDGWTAPRFRPTMDAAFKQAIRSALLPRLAMAIDAEFKEHEHPRDESGKFTEVGGGGKKAAPSAPGAPSMGEQPGRLIEVERGDPKAAVHFVGFRDGEKYNNAVKVFGKPDFYHYVWDYRAQADIAPGDTVVFAKGGPDQEPTAYSYDDSNQPDDPAAAERKEKSQPAPSKPEDLEEETLPRKFMRQFLEEGGFKLEGPDPFTHGVMYQHKDQTLVTLLPDNDWSVFNWITGEGRQGHGIFKLQDAVKATQDAARKAIEAKELAEKKAQKVQPKPTVPPFGKMQEAHDAVEKITNPVQHYRDLEDHAHHVFDQAGMELVVKAGEGTEPDDITVHNFHTGEEIPLDDLPSELKLLADQLERANLRAAERELQIKEKGHSRLTQEEAKEAADIVTSALGYNPDKIEVRTEDKTFTVGGVEHHTAGEAYTQFSGEDKGKIKLYHQHCSPSFIGALTAHETMHCKFQAVLDEYGIEKKKLHELEHPWWDEGGPLRPDASLREGFADKYPVYAALYPVMEGYTDTGPVHKKLEKSDGTTSYSKEYWAAWRKNDFSVDLRLAYHETLAEIAAQHWKTGKVDAAPAWRKLYATVNRLYATQKKRGYEWFEMGPQWITAEEPLIGEHGHDQKDRGRRTASDSGLPQRRFPASGRGRGDVGQGDFRGWGHPVGRSGQAQDRKAGRLTMDGWGSPRFGRDAFVPAHAPKGSAKGGQFVSKGGGAGSGGKSAPIHVNPAAWTGRSGGAPDPRQLAKKAAGSAKEFFHKETKEDYDVIRKSMPDAQKSWGQNMANMAMGLPRLVQAWGADEVQSFKNGAGAFKSLINGQRPTPEQYQGLRRVGFKLLMSVIGMTHGDPTGALPHMAVAGVTQVAQDLGMDIVHDAILEHSAKFAVAGARHVKRAFTGGAHDAAIDPDEMKWMQDFVQTLAKVVASYKFDDAKIARSLNKRRQAATDAEFKEEQHKRDEGGKFSKTAGSKAGAAKPAPATKAEQAPAKGAPKGKHPGHGYSEGATVDEKGVIHTGNVNDAVRALYENRKVRLEQPRQVSTLVARLGDVAKRMEKLGGKVPNFDLCNVAVEGTNLFCATSKGIPRAEMPQLPEEKGPAFRRHLEDKGFKTEETTEKASYLRATQRELVGVKVSGIMKYFRGKDASEDAPLFISSDGYIVDGHHRWAARVGLDAESNKLGGVELNVVRVDLPIIDLLQEAEDFTGGKGHKKATANDAKLRWTVRFDTVAA